MRPPTWLSVSIDTDSDRQYRLNVKLATCRNCGKVKLTSDPCGFDHLASILEYRAQYGIPI